MTDDNDFNDTTSENDTTFSVSEADEDQTGMGGVESSSRASKLKSSAFVPSVVSNAVEKVAGLSGVALQGVIKHGPRDAELKKAVKKESGSEGKAAGATVGNGGSEFDLKGEEGVGSQNNVEDPQEVGKLETAMREKLHGVSLKDRPEPGDEVMLDARAKNKDVRDILGGREGTGHATSHQGNPLDAAFSLNTSRTGSHSLDDPMLADNLLRRDLGSAPEQTGGAN